MSVLNNSAAQISLGELNKSINKLGKALAVVASGQKINGAKDDSAAFSISEQMRTKLRALEQDVQNVQNGSSMLKTAEGAIQQQIELLKTVREKVIDANNDSNTDDDRRIMQKEINQLYDQIEQVAYYTEYNTKKILLGDTVKDTELIMVPAIETVESTLTSGQAGNSGALDLIDDVYKELDGITAGPFDTLKDYKIEETSIRPLGLNPSITVKAGDYNATPYEYAYTSSNSTAKITNWNNAAAPFMNNRGFYIRTVDSDTGASSTKYYVLTDSPGSNVYSRSNITEIDTSGCSTVAQVMAKIDDEVDAIKSHSGNKIVVDKSATLEGWSQYAVREETTSDFGPFSTPKNFSGAVYDNYWREGGFSSSDQFTADRWYPDTSKIKAGTVSATFNIDDIADNSGFTVYNGNGVEIGRLRFVDGALYSDANTTVEVGHQCGDDDIVNVSKEYLKKNPTAKFNLSVGSSVKADITSTGVTLSASPYGGYYDGANTNADKMKDSGFTVANNINKYYVRSGISTVTGTANVHVRALGFDKQSSEAEFDLSDYQSTDPDELEKFISSLAGKAIRDDSYANGYLGRTTSYTNSTRGWHYEFIDSASSDFNKNRKKISYDCVTPPIDLNSLRGMVGTVDNNGRKQTIADAFAELFDRRTYYTQTVDNSSTTVHLVTKNYNDNDETAGVKSITLATQSLAKSDSTMTAVEGVLRHYDIDFNKWFDSEDGAALVDYNLMGEYIDGKGFRAFCATDDTEWFNFIFRDGQKNFTDETFDSSPNIHSFQIDVSNVKSAQELVKRIYDQCEPQLKEINHFFHFKTDKSGVLTIFDDRPYTNYFFRSSSSTYPQFQKGDGLDMEDNLVVGAQTPNGGGAKVADGIIEAGDPRILKEKFLVYQEKHVPKRFERTLQIQDTTKSNLNIRVRIPQMTLNNIFYPLPDRTKKIQDYDVMSKAKRDALLGDPRTEPPIEGILDRGLEYMLEANTLVGAQIARLEFTETNLGRTLENTQAAESTIRDADMAKAMTEYTKQNVLMQASQSMLAQANQNSASILGLLQ